jgi:hypothetical protein
MLVEVNLLPEKNRRNMTYPLLFLILILVIAIGMTLLYVYQSNMSSEVSEIKEEIASVQLEAAEIKQQLPVTEGNDYDRLQQAVTVIEGQVVPASLLLDYLVKRLPERGYYLNFDYELPGKVSFDASFDRMEEIAAYHQELELSDVVADVTLSIINTNDLEIDPDYVLPRYIASFSLDIQKSEVRKLGESQ